MSREALLIQEIQKLKSSIKQTKSAISNMNTRRRALSSQPLAPQGQGLAQALRSIIPHPMMPKNVGNINHVSWQFDETMEFDLTETPEWPNLTSTTTQTRSFQVSQESAFVMMGVKRHADDYNSAGDLGPLTIEFRDRQSSRFFNNAPIPIQMIAQKGYVTYMPTPMLILPNAFMDCTLSTHLAPGVVQNTPGGSSGKHKITCVGYRIRIKDADKVLSSIFGQ